MSLKVKEIDSPKAWNKFVEKFSPNNFLASWQWIEFNNLIGDKTIPLGYFEDDKLVAVCPASITISKKGNFLLSQGGPLLEDFKNRSCWSTIVSSLKSLSFKHKLKFIRIRPTVEGNEYYNNLLASLGFRKAPVRMPAEVSLILNITKPESEILANMRKTTRYLIRKASAMGVKVFSSTNPSDLDIYHKLELLTVARHHFTPFSRKYIKTQFEVFRKTNDAIIFFAEFKGEIIASAIVTFFGDSAFYNHGSSLKTKVPGSYLIQWYAILEAKRRGKKFYNFWGGIVPQNVTKDHPWSGISLFKTGFGGEIFSTIHAHDMPLSVWYWPISVFEYMRYKFRGHTL